MGGIAGPPGHAGGIDLYRIHVAGPEGFQNAGVRCPGSVHIDLRIHDGLEGHMTPKADLRTLVVVLLNPHSRNRTLEGVEDRASGFSKSDP